MLSPRIVLREFSAIGALRLFSIAFPLLYIPFVARSLGIDGLGVLLFFMSISVWLGAIVQFGFDITATRDIVMAPKSEWARYTAQVWASQGMLVVVAFLLLGGLYFALPIVRENAGMAVISWAIGVAQGMLPRWYFRATQRMHVLSIIETTPKLIALPLLSAAMAVAPAPHVAYLVFLLGHVASLLIALRIILPPLLPLPWPSFNLAMLRRDVPIFISELAGFLYSAANVLVLGFYAPAAVVGHFATAQRVVWGAIHVNGTVPQAMFPVMALAYDQDRRKAVKLLILSVLFVASIGCAAAALTWVAAPLIVGVLLGAGNEPVIHLIRAFVFLIPVFGIAQVLSGQGLLPLGGTRIYSAITVGFGVLHAALSVLLVPEYGALVIIWLLISTMVCVALSYAVAIALLFRRRVKSDLRDSPHPAPLATCAH